MKWLYFKLTKFVIYMQNKYFLYEPEELIRYKIEHNYPLSQADRLCLLMGCQRVMDGKMKLSEYINKYGTELVDEKFLPLITEHKNLTDRNALLGSLYDRERKRNEELELKCDKLMHIVCDEPDIPEDCPKENQSQPTSTNKVHITLAKDDEEPMLSRIEEANKPTPHERFPIDELSRLGL